MARLVFHPSIIHQTIRDLFLYEVLKEKDMLNYFVNQFGLQAAYMDRNQNTAMCYRFLYNLLTSLEKKKAENDSFYENY